MVFGYFFTSCIEAGPNYCALAGLNKTAAELEQDAWQLLDSIRNVPLAVGYNIIDLFGIKSLIIGSLHGDYEAPDTWYNLSALLRILMYGNQEQKQSLVDGLVSHGIGGPADFDFPTLSSLMGIHCGDNLVRVQSFEDAAPAFAKLASTSKLVGDTVQWISAHCAQWPWHAMETYKGDFRVKTKKPILVVSNVRDAHTPLRSALNISSSFEGSRVLAVNGTGVSLIMQSFFITLLYRDVHDLDRS
jgi:hypothetical protein